MNYKKISSETYRKFANKDGNDHIAGDYALQEILRIIGKFRCKNILEIGLGIGSISDAILEYSVSNNLNINYSGTEANQYCLEQLPQNVKEFDQIILYNDISEVPEKEMFDLIIIDGSDNLLSNIKRNCTQNSIIFIEGGRNSQVLLVNTLFPKNKLTRLMSLKRPPVYGPFQQRWSGGATVIAINPTMAQRIYIFEEKCTTFIKTRIRRMLK